MPTPPLKHTPDLAQTPDPARKHPFHTAVIKSFPRAVKDLLSDDALTLAAAIAYYSALSFAPMVMLAVWITSMLGVNAQRLVIDQAEQLAGPQAGEVVRTVIENADDNPGAGTVSGIVSIAVLLVSATGVFAQLQKALNVVFDVEARPSAGPKGSIINLLRARLLSMGMLAAIGFLLVVSLVATTGIQAVTRQVGVADSGLIWKILYYTVSAVIFSGLFGALFKLVPDIKLRWKHALIGGAMTAVLFGVGKLGLGFYLAGGGVGSSYGAAGSLIALLVWVYYSAVIVFLGGELTQAWMHLRGHPIEPDTHAVSTDDDGLG